MRKQAGGISVFMLVMLVSMLVFAAWVTDVMRIYSVHNQVANATDAALASAIISEVPEATAVELLNANLSSGAASPFMQDVRLTHQRDEQEENLQVELDFVPNSLNVAASEIVPISAHAKAGVSSNKAEIVFMLDVSNSMSGEPMAKTKEALLAFADKLYSRGNRNQNYVVSIVPASGNVNTGPMEEIYLGAFRRHNHAQVKRENGWSDMFDRGNGRAPAVPGRKRNAMCRDLEYEGNNPGTLGLRYFRNLEKQPQFANNNSKRIIRPMHKPAVSVFDDGTPLDPAVYPSTNTRENYRPFHEDKAIFDDIECHVNPIVPFITERRLFESTVQRLVPGMNTNNAEGMVWAMRLLSPYWQGIWDASRPQLPRHYGDENSSKYLVMFSDGNHLIDPAFRDKKMKLICTQLKQPGRDVKVITINFGGAASQRLMQSCASGPEFYHVASLFSVERVFEQIADQVISSSLIE
ncbi:VWA domain-containing protein [Vibrio vulnificus]|nr:VWA domain-containing protein [Vibrio vulnificus]